MLLELKGKESPISVFGMTQLCAGALQHRNEDMNVFLRHFSRGGSFPRGPAGPCSQSASLHPGPGPCSALGDGWEKQESAGSVYMLTC